MKYFTSDSHLFHKNILELDKRPFASIEEMAAKIVANWNAIVRKEDTVYHLGDLAFGKPSKAKDIVNSLNGQIILVRGNHCRENDWTSRKIHEAGITNIKDVCDITWMTLGDGCRFTLCHYPYKDAYEFEDRIAEKYPADNGNWLIHGHVHAREAEGVTHKMINVGCMLWDYKPVSEQQIMDIVRASVGNKLEGETK